ncbi:MAG: Lrp/AsnC family transcriptional regulator [Candidatus Helarchaeota archaeon]
MIRALMVVKAKTGKWKEIVENLKSIEQIKQISTLTGIYDLMLEIQVERMEELNEVMLEKIDIIDGILSTNTFIVLKDYK